MLSAKIDPRVALDRYEPPKPAKGKATPALDAARRRAKILPRPWKALMRRLFPTRDAFDESDVLTAKRPINIGCETTNVCNARCSFCGYGKGDDGKDSGPRTKGKIDIKAFRHALKLYSEAGGGVFSVEPILGEVTAHPDWLDLIREARNTPNISGVSTYSNGILLHRFGFENILTSGLTVMNISSSLTNEEGYKRLYGVDKYEQVISNILELIKTNKRLGSPVDIHLMLRIDKPYSNFFDSDLYREIVSYIKPEKIFVEEKHWDDFRGVISLEDLPKGHKFKTNPVDKTEPCYAMFRKLQILTDGTFQACSCRVEPELWGDNITGYETLEGVWHDPRIEELRNDWFEGDIPTCCLQCTHYQPYTSLVPDMSFPTISKRVINALGRRLLRLVA